MILKVGIIGLPNVGKSTLFNAITNSQIKTANYPFTTINENIGIVNIPDKRIDKLNKIFMSDKKIYSIFEFYDIAGLISGSSNNKGLGNSFLSIIRETDIICMVIRCFDDNNIIHIEGTIDPIRDIDLINLELIISDQEQIKKRINKIIKKIKNLKQKEIISEYKILIKLEKVLKKNNLLKDIIFSCEELKIIKNFNLLTIKPFIYIINISKNYLNKLNNVYIKKVKEYAYQKKIKTVVICAKLEEELSLSKKINNKLLFNNYIIKKSGLNELIKKIYSLLNLQTFFTVGKKEVRSWIFKKGTTALMCSGIIHSYFKRGFIKVEIYSFNDLIKYGNEKLIKINGCLQNKGKNYIMQDGDICFFKFNI